MEALTSSSSSSSGGPAASHVRRRASAFGPSSSAVRTTQSSLRCCYSPRRPGHPVKCSAAASSPSSAPASAVVKGAAGIEFGFGFGFASGSANPSRDAEADKFAEAAKKGNLVPLYECIVSDHLTPVLAYRCLVKEDDKESPSFIFESVHQDSQGINNVVYTYIYIYAHPPIFESFFFLSFFPVVLILSHISD